MLDACLLPVDIFLGRPNPGHQLCNSLIKVLNVLGLAPAVNRFSRHRSPFCSPLILQRNYKKGIGAR
jgi:hypothetical protein